MAEKGAHPKGKHKSTPAQFIAALPNSDSLLDSLRKHPKKQDNNRNNSNNSNNTNNNDYQPVSDNYGQVIEDPIIAHNGSNRRRPRTMHASNWFDDEMDSEDNDISNIYSSNSEVLVNMYDYNQLLNAVIQQPLAPTRFNYPAGKNLQQENGLIVTVERSRRYDMNALVWEAIMSLSDRSTILAQLRAKQWVLPGHMDMYNTSSNQKVASAPLGYNCFSYLALSRVFFKMIDDAPPTAEAKLTCALTALKIFEWYFNKLASGKNERTVKRHVLESIQDDGDIVGLFKRLKMLDAQHTAFGRKSIDDYRDDIIINNHAKTEGCVAPTLLREIRRNNHRSGPPRAVLRRVGAPIKIKPRGSYRSGFSAAKGRPPAPMLDKYFDEKKHQPQSADRSFPADLCKKWQNDSCILPNGQRCSRFHLCQWCGLPHPGAKCKNYGQ